MRLTERVVLLALCMAVACSSQSTTESAPASATPTASTQAEPAAPAAAAEPAAAAPAAAPSPPGAAPSGPAPAADEPKEVCPFPRRCEHACTKANSKAMDVCGPTGRELMKLLPNADELGRCIAACLKVKEAKMCVGPATESECACTRKCKDLIPAALLEKGKVYDACYRKAIEAACY